VAAIFDVDIDITPGAITGFFGIRDTCRCRCWSW